MLHAGLYGIARQGAAYLSGGLAYGWFGGTTQRTVSVMGVERLKSDTNAQNVAARVEGGLRLPIAYGMMPKASVTPYAALQVQRMEMGSSSEQTTTGGTSPFALTYGSQLRTFSRSELGARFASQTQLPDGTGVTFQARAAWAHDYDTDIVANAAFQSLPAAAFSVAGARAAADSALLSAGVEMQLTESISLSTKVDGEFSSTTTMYSGTLNARVTW
jgi:outer membrane autotransporter protein